jgi:hypothetical protein
MDPAVKPPARSYDNSARARSSRAGQLRVADLTAQMLVERGYGATTMAGIATAARVSVPGSTRCSAPSPTWSNASTTSARRQPGAGSTRPAAGLPRSDGRSRPAAGGRALRRDFRRPPHPSRPLAAALLSAAQSAGPELAGLAATISRERLYGATAFTDQLAGLRRAADPRDLTPDHWGAASSGRPYGVAVIGS